MYGAAGTYTVALTVTSAGGMDTETKVDYVVVGPTVLATESQRNGIGVNPAIFTTSSMPMFSSCEPGAALVLGVNIGSLSCSASSMPFGSATPDTLPVAQ